MEHKISRAKNKFRQVLRRTYEEFGKRMLPEFLEIEELMQPKLFRKPRFDELSKRTDRLSQSCLEMIQRLDDDYWEQGAEVVLFDFDGDKSLKTYHDLFSNVLCHMGAACDIRIEIQSELAAIKSGFGMRGIPLADYQREFVKETEAFLALIPELKRSGNLLYGI